MLYWKAGVTIVVYFLLKKYQFSSILNDNIKLLHSTSMQAFATLMWQLAGSKLITTSTCKKKKKIKTNLKGSIRLLQYAFYR